MPIRRRSQFRNRVQKMIGIPIEEKMALLRMGELVDTAVNNRATTGPGADEARVGRRHKRKTRVVPQPINLSADVGTRGAILRWDKVDSQALLNYQVRIVPVEGTGVEFTATAFSNEYAFKGEAGSYKFEARSIGRNGGGSDWSAAEFFEIQDTPIILEGNKFGVEELGAQISETVLTPLNYTAFIFASIVLNSFSDPNNNSACTLELRHGDTYEQSVFVQEFDLYPESEDLNSFDTTLGITRPSSSPGRSGTFNTTQSAMFSPYQILEGNAIADKNTKFWITVTGHSDDVVGLSVSIWVASEGLSETEETETVIVHDKCIELPISSVTKPAFGVSEDTFNNEGDDYWDNIWSFGIWLKPSDFTENMEILGKYSVTGAAIPNNNGLVFIDWLGSSSTLEVQARANDGTTTADATYVGINKVWPLGLDRWHLLVVTFNGVQSGSKFDVYINGVAIGADTDTSSTVTISSAGPGSDLYTIGMAPTFGNGNSYLFGIYDASDYMFSGRVHAAGHWDVVLSSSAVNSLYNNGVGAAVDWRSSKGNYANQNSLRHYWRFGALDNDLVGPPDPVFPSKYFKYTIFGGASSAASQSNIDTNRARDISFDIGNHQEADYYDVGKPVNRGIDFTNGLFVSGGVSTYTEDRNCTALSRAVLGSTTPSPVDIINDYPGLELGF